jgi:acyl carrier protein
MDEISIDDVLFATVEEVLGKQLPERSLDLPLQELGVSSLDFLRLLAALERKLGGKYSDSFIVDVGRSASLGDLLCIRESA